MTSFVNRLQKRMYESSNSKHRDSNDESSLVQATKPETAKPETPKVADLTAAAETHQRKTSYLKPSQQPPLNKAHRREISMDDIEKGK